MNMIVLVIKMAEGAVYGGTCCNDLCLCGQATQETRGLILNRKKSHLTDLLKGIGGYPPFVCNMRALCVL